MALIVLHVLLAEQPDNKTDSVVVGIFCYTVKQNGKLWFLTGDFW